MKTLSRLGVPLLLAFLMLFVATSPALADSQHLNGWYWEGGPVDLYFLIENDVSTESWTAWYNAHEEWNEAQYSPTEFIYTENSQIDLITAQYGYSSLTWDGKWFPDPISPPGSLNHADVKLNEYYTNGYAYYKRVAIAVHELGHTLGLAHNNDGNYIMNSSPGQLYDDYQIYWPTSVDVDHVNELY